MNNKYRKVEFAINMKGEKKWRPRLKDVLGEGGGADLESHRLKLLSPRFCFILCFV